jgi:hypothetical protein
MADKLHWRQKVEEEATCSEVQSGSRSACMIAAASPDGLLGESVNHKINMQLM